MGLAALIPFIPTALEVIGNIFGGKKKTSAISDVSRQQGNYQQQLQNYQSQLFGIQKPVLEAQQQAALGAFPLLTQDINRQAGTGAPFQQALNRGAQNVFSSLAPYGLTDSSVSGRAIGDLNANLLAQDTQQLRDARFKLAGMEPGVLGQATGLFGPIGQAYANQGNLGIGQGITEGNTTGNIFDAVGGLFGKGGAGTQLLQGAGSLFGGGNRGNSIADYTSDAFKSWAG